MVHVVHIVFSRELMHSKWNRCKSIGRQVIPILVQMAEMIELSVEALPNSIAEGKPSNNLLPYAVSFWWYLSNEFANISTSIGWLVVHETWSCYFFPVYSFEVFRTYLCVLMCVEKWYLYCTGFLVMCVLNLVGLGTVHRLTTIVVIIGLPTHMFGCVRFLCRQGDVFPDVCPYMEPWANWPVGYS
jgi:hypothetical protein